MMFSMQLHFQEPISLFSVIMLHCQVFILNVTKVSINEVNVGYLKVVPVGDNLRLQNTAIFFLMQQAEVSQ